jgi:hypothetical protein
MKRFITNCAVWLAIIAIVAFFFWLDRVRFVY